MAKHIAVLMGGWSNERPVSLNSGKGCAQALRNGGYRVTEVDVGRDIAGVLAELRPDVAFNALHGPFGESGMIQGVLELLQIPYTHSGVLASALAMDKHQAKIALKAAGSSISSDEGIPSQCAGSIGSGETIRMCRTACASSCAGV